jgi:hypothetical protein
MLDRSAWLVADVELSANKAGIDLDLSQIKNGGFKAVR